MNSYLVRASALQGYRDTVLELGGDPDLLLAQAGLTGMDANPDAWFSYSAYLQLLENSALSTRCPHFGLQLSARQDLGMLGALGFIIQQAPDIRTALRNLSQYFSHHLQGAVVSTTVEDGFTRWAFTAMPQLNAPMYQQSDLAAGIAVKVMHMLHTDWKPVAIYLPHSAPADTRPYRKLFDCPVHFDWDRTVIASDARFLDIPLNEANPQLHRVLESHLRDLQTSFPNDYRAQVSYLIKQALPTGDCSIERVSGFLSVNKRTLQRKLQAQGINYKKLQDEVRFEIARNYLQETAGSLTVLAHMLCYSELSVFSTAFRAHHGVSPTIWKQQTGVAQAPGA